MLKKITIWFSRFLFFTLILFSIFSVGYYFGNRNTLNATSTKAGKLSLTSSDQPKDVDFSLFWEAWRKVDDEFVDIKKVNKQKRIEASIKGMLSGLDDPYTTYLGPLTNKRWIDDLNGYFDGIGAEITMKEGLLTVIAPLESSPAKKAGIKAQDVISKIDNKKTEDMDFEEAIMKIRGQKGSKVELTILRDGIEDELTLTIIRDIIEIKSVKYSFDKNNKISIISINQFGNDTIKLLKEALNQAKKDNSSGVVIDLRNDPGGLLETAIDAISLFLPDDLSKYKENNLKSGVVVIQKGKNKNEIKYKRTLKNLNDLPFVILQNKGSASASEIFAGAMKDYKLAKIIGTISFGKGSVQNLADLSNGGGVKVTIAKWFTPLDITIDGKGINPDIIVKDAEIDKSDPALEKAFEVLKSNN